MNELSRCPFCEVVAAKSTLIARPYWHKKNGCLLSGQHFTEEEWQTRPLEDALQKRIDEYDHGAKAFIVFCPIAINRPIVLEEAKRFLIEYAGIKELAKTPFGDFMDVEFIKVRNEELLASL